MKYYAVSAEDLLKAGILFPEEDDEIFIWWDRKFIRQLAEQNLDFEVLSKEDQDKVLNNLLEKLFNIDSSDINEEIDRLTIESLEELK